QKEKAYWESDPSGVVLNFGAVMGFIVGVIVVYQVLYSDVAEHLPEYATLKAMGYADRALLMVVLQEAMILALLGFIPGCVASVGVYKLLSSLTKIPLALRPDVASQVFLLTLVMCGMAGAIAIQKLRKADPADVF
ncbi:MAG TPA: FtsX-like permease family protein, partial [Candidatus Caenarcaniphilales bacterium]